MILVLKVEIKQLGTNNRKTLWAFAVKDTPAKKCLKIERVFFLKIVIRFEG